MDHVGRFGKNDSRLFAVSSRPKDLGARFAIGDEKIQNPKIAFSPIWDDAKMSATGSRLTSRVAGLPSMVLGLDFLKSHRVLLISSQGRMYFKFNGGTVFAAPGDQKVVPGLIGSAATSGAFGERETARR